jgi:hypothetical protein
MFSLDVSRVSHRPLAKKAKPVHDRVFPIKNMKVRSCWAEKIASETRGSFEIVRDNPRAALAMGPVYLGICFGSGEAKKPKVIARFHSNQIHPADLIRKPFITEAGRVG